MQEIDSTIICPICRNNENIKAEDPILGRGIYLCVKCKIQFDQSLFWNERNKK
jgi:hypothetical protein